MDKRKDNNNGIGVLLAPLLYVGALCGAQTLSDLASPRIVSQAHLEKILDAEKTRAGIDENVEVVIEWDQEENIAQARRISEGVYWITLPSKSTTVSILRHELYHVADGHCDKPYTVSGIRIISRKLLLHEPQATVYQITGWKP